MEGSDRIGTVSSGFLATRLPEPTDPNNPSAEITPGSSTVPADHAALR